MVANSSKRRWKGKKGGAIKIYYYYYYYYKKKKKLQSVWISDVSQNKNWNKVWVYWILYIFL